MRKAISAPCLLALGQRGLHQSESDSDCPSRQRCSASRHASLPQHSKRLRGRHGGRAQRAHALFWPMAELPSAPLAEAEELVLESSFPRGLASAECFELYGSKQAPALVSAASAEASERLRTIDSSAERLAACLATPFTGDDKNMGEILEGHVRRAITEAQVNTQLRYAMEVQLEQEFRDSESESEVAPRRLTTRSRRVTRRRRPSEERLLAAFLDGQARSAPLPTSGPPSPATRSVLSSMFSSFDDEANPNRLVVDAQPADTLETLTAAGTALASVDLVPPPEPDQAPEPFGAAGAALMELVGPAEPHPAPDYARERSRTSMAALTQGLCP